MHPNTSLGASNTAYNNSSTSYSGGNSDGYAAGLGRAESGLGASTLSGGGGGDGAGSTTTPTDPSTSNWDSLRRDARRLESEAEAQLAALARAVAGLTPEPGSSAGGGRASEQLAVTRAAEAAALLQRLGDVHDAMGAACAGAAAPARAHALARHRDVLAELTRELRRLDGAAAAARDRAALFGGGSNAAPLLGVQVHSATATAANAAVLRERAQIASAASRADDALAAAAAVSRGLSDQRRLLAGAHGKLEAVAERFPAVNALLNSIRRRKGRDAAVLAATVAGCLVLFLLLLMARRR